MGGDEFATPAAPPMEPPSQRLSNADFRYKGTAKTWPHLISNCLTNSQYVINLIQNSDPVLVEIIKVISNFFSNLFPIL